MFVWELLQFLWRAKWPIIACVVLAVGVAAWLIGTAQPRYRAQAVLKVVSNNRLNSLTSASSGIGGLASLAGINIGGNEEAGVAVGTLKSRSFTAEFISDHNLLPVLFADRWDAAKKAWRGPAPTMTQAVDKFDRGGIRTVVEDRRTGFVVLQIEWKDPRTANDWLTGMVIGVNKQLREQKMREAAQSIAYLEKQLAQTQAIEVRESAYRLMEVQMKDMMISSTQEDYALKYVDAPILPVAPQDRVWPRPLLMLASSVMIGGMLGLVLAFLLYAQSSPLTLARRARSREPAAT
jgi:LPS O-antigen subunit length determinant protein (WzzB/FepE family)